MTASPSTPLRRLLTISLLLLFSALAACTQASLLTQANLDKIQPGMSTADVKAILGEPTESKTEPIPVVGGTKTTYDYSSQDAHVEIVFKNDNLQTKEGHFGSAQ